MLRFGSILICLFISMVLCNAAFGFERFPPPEFEETNHQLPTTDYITDVTPDHPVYEYLDVAVLVIALSLASWLVLKKRSRRSVFILMVFSLLYFGFFRKGCVCSIGAIQNFFLSIFDSNYSISVTAILFLILPLVFTLFFGRTFCAGVCPLGAIQDLVVLHPVKVPTWLESSLRLFAYIYLAGAIVFAATGSSFIICRYDPFVSFFRLSGHLHIIVLGCCFLVIGIFIGRPYCRFICPYGVILRQLSRLSKWKVTITPDDCIKCRLCEDSCPFGAINKPTVDWPKTGYAKSRRLLALLIIAIPVLMFLGGWIGASLNQSSARMHATVRLAERVYQENQGLINETTDASLAFRATGEPIEDLYEQASVIRKQFKFGGWLLGALIGLIAGLKLIMPSIRRQRTDFQADSASCLACGRCFKSCPREHVRLKSLREKQGKADDDKK